MTDTWTRFAHDGGPDAPRWEANEPAALTFGSDGTTTTDPSATHRCAFWADRM